MKIYLFDNETGCYQGEDFADQAPGDVLSTMLEEGITTIAPPPYGPGEIPVFHGPSAAWQISRITDLKR
ncbi:hypothetical protein [Geomonas silvestris]|nr:hypothetical protein [Geomonas silvestris]